jgi:hypothetical protein
MVFVGSEILLNSWLVFLVVPAAIFVHAHVLEEEKFCTGISRPPIPATSPPPQGIFNPRSQNIKWPSHLGV